MTELVIKMRNNTNRPLAQEINEQGESRGREAEATDAIDAWHDCQDSCVASKEA